MKLIEKLILKKYLFIGIISVFLGLLFGIAAQAQSPRKIIQFSGLIVSGDSAFGTPGVYVFVPKEGRGTVSNAIGYFSMAALTGDSIVIKSIGYKEKFFVIPYTFEDKISVIIEIMEDTLYMPIVEITPWPTERLFKEAFVALKLPEQDLKNMNHNLNDQVLKRMMYNLGADGNMNSRYYLQQQTLSVENQYFAPTLTLLNPFAWKNFIDGVKRGDLKKTYPNQVTPESE
ncbi:carboxypeptidase-like regulatory domain-containing protein [uncultured Cytophaga sp.]|uniref:carboxypeptidase-like regulatory domain-containing protein n=1 Tax=uncultured Cytophaga sp. TaxID=160238 RepID=UPI0026320DB1|nr:carboxypeptidase-like regulatory domain-containing protein [uncultured Cytophaga sp.]